METVTLTIDGRQVTVEKGKTVLQAAIESGISVPYYCYHPGHRHRRLVPRLHRQDREDAEAADVVLDRLHRRHGRAHADRRCRRGARRRVRVPADQPSARLPGLRQGRRVPAAGFLLHVRTRSEPHGVSAPGVRRRGREGRRRLRPDADAQPQPLHPLHAVRPVHARRRRRRADQHHRSRLRQRDRDVPGRRRALADLRQPDGRLPGRRDHDAGLPLQVAAVGQPERRRHDLHAAARRAATRRRGSRPSRSGRRARG